MRVVSFNVYCAPIMHDRLKRVDNVKNYIESLKDVDVMALQETTTFYCGIIAYIIFKFFSGVLRYFPRLCDVDRSVGCS
jgi:hypothetical protein